METIPTFAPEDIQKNKTIAILANVPGLFWLPFAAAQDSQFAKFYCNQGFWLLMASIASSIVGGIPLIGWIVSIALSIAVLVFMIIGMIAASKGEAKEVPVLGKIVIFK